MEHGDYPLRLQEHLVQHGFREETIASIGRMCRVGQVSEQSALELLEVVEADRRASDEELAGCHPETAWDEDMLASRRRAKQLHSVDS